MSDLQIGLISLGIVLILLVLVFNWWQDRRLRGRMREHFPEADQDPLMGGLSPVVGRREPGLNLAPAIDGAPAEDAPDVDPHCEAVIDIVFAQPVSSEQLYAATHSLRTVGSKPVRVFAKSEGGGHRANLRQGESYTSMQLAVLLANRSGPLTDIEWSHLWTAAQALAERFDGVVEGPEQEQVIQHATQLDELCAGLDAQVGLALRLGGTRPVTDVTRQVKDAGFLSHGGHLAWLADSGTPRFVLLYDGVHVQDVQSAGVDRIDLLLDVPNSPADGQAFSRMASVGRDLAGRLNATLVDDQGQAVSEASDKAIDEQLRDMYGKLDQAGFPAGGERAIRVFS
ncbi:MAG TPA: cell division protein ZipA C-terminal FtsZ-binding domain-containing protein [Burkholderiaceae bacterium]|nr:cell division protein ZipA C-terminal FtsZ-binding domain-containing protein [Burkholderiaceae bacterium]